MNDHDTALDVEVKEIVIENVDENSLPKKFFNKFYLDDVYRNYLSGETVIENLSSSIGNGIKIISRLETVEILENPKYLRKNRLMVYERNNDFNSKARIFILENENWIFDSMDQY